MWKQAKKKLNDYKTNIGFYSFFGNILSIIVLDIEKIIMYLNLLYAILIKTHSKVFI